MRSDDGAVDHRDAVRAAVHRGEAALELGDLRPVQPAPRAAAQRAEQPRLLGFTEDGPGRERAGADGRSAEKGECVACRLRSRQLRGGLKAQGSRVKLLAM